MFQNNFDTFKKYSSGCSKKQIQSTYGKEFNQFIKEFGSIILNQMK